MTVAVPALGHLAATSDSAQAPSAMTILSADGSERPVGHLGSGRPLDAEDDLFTLARAVAARREDGIFDLESDVADPDLAADVR